jgi:hypothetical protein
LETHLLFINYEKAFDNIQRQILFNIFKSRHIPDILLKIIVDVYTQNEIMIKFYNKISELVEINKGVRQEGSETSANINQTLGIHPKIETVSTTRLPSFTYTVFRRNNN